MPNSQENSGGQANEHQISRETINEDESIGLQKHRAIQSTDICDPGSGELAE